MVMDPPSGRSSVSAQPACSQAPAGCNDHAPTSRPEPIPPPLTCKDVKDGTQGRGDGMPKDAAVEEFAGLVRALKARDGRSYEALGRRLSISASTLHRYCSGATVPEEFAVLDRLALLCGRGCPPGGPCDLSRARRSARITRPGGRTL
ncbi:helix-turn-helix domain-containing protein [Streptomyces microflavus]|uniref:helix-turn-helix domain-containing protein n=1 Tax=Streptomyces microflavus TaxID=1919 RepID=UPI003F4E055C